MNRARGRFAGVGEGNRSKVVEHKRRGWRRRPEEGAGRETRKMSAGAGGLWFDGGRKRPSRLMASIFPSK